MKLTAQRRLAARMLKCGESRVWMDPARLGDISQAITTQDVNKLIADGIIDETPKLRGVSKARRTRLIVQKRKGRRRGHGSRKSSGAGMRNSKKSMWMARVRAQRKLLKELLQAGRINNNAYKNLYLKSKGGFFRSRAHILSYVHDSGENVTKEA